MQDVAIFWDYENCSPPSNASGYIVANNIRLIAQAYGSIKSFKAYLEITDQVSSARVVALRSEFQSSGVSLTDCPHNGRKEVADKMIIVDMLAYAIDNPAPSVVVLISGDRDFAYALSILRLRQYQVILVTLSNAHPSLTSQASACVDWHSEVINPVVQPPSRTANNLTMSVSRTAPIHDSPPGQSSPSQSSQYTLTQETEPVERTDHGDLLHYLRASTSSRPRRTSDASFSIGNGQQARYERPRQDASPPIEVEPVYARPILVSESPTNLLKTSASNSPAIHAISDSVHNQSSTLAQYGTKDAVVDPTDTRTSFFSLSANHGQPFSTSLPKIDSSPPTLLPSIMQETPQHSPVAQYTVLETDIPDDDSSDLQFTNPIRPSSAPHSLPSQSPFIFVGEPLGSEMSTILSGSPNAEALSIPMDSSTDQQHIPTSQETPGNPVSSVVNSTSLSDAMSEEICNNPDLDPPDINPSNQQSPSATNSNEADQPSAMAVVCQASTSIAGSPRPIDRLPPITPIMSCMNLPGTSVLNVQNTVDRPSPIIPSAGPRPSKPKIVVPPIFKILVDILRVERSKGCTRPLRSSVADAIYKNGFKYKDTGVSKFSQYTALAEEQGIVELGFLQKEAWISLKPEYQNPPPAPIVPTTPVVPRIFKLLVETLQVNKSNGILRPSRSNIAIAISRNGLTYKEAGVNTFGEYASLAEQRGIIELGGREGDAWISLKPEYQNASTT